jgi:hypothetical protein
MRLTTYQDIIEHLSDYEGGSTGDDTIRYCRRAIQDAYNHYGTLHNWSYLYSRMRVTTNAAVTAGTIAYTNSTLTVVLTGATWPNWVTQGVLVINNIPYAIASNPTSTTLTLPPQNNPGADVAALTPYTLYQDTYNLPIDFTSCDEIMNINYGLRLTYEHAATWLTFQRIYRGPATPRIYSITGSPGFFGAMSVRFFPPPDNIYFMDAIYKRRLRPLSTILVETGTASTTSGSTTVTGAGTNWDSTMVGASFRIAIQGNNVTPTGPSGESPFYIERTILAVASPTSLTVDADPVYTGTQLSYAISDPVDIEEGAMLNFMLRLCEKQIRISRRIKSPPEEIADYQASKMEAMEADNRSSMRQAVGAGGYPRRLRDFPSGPDMG